MSPVYNPAFCPETNLKDLYSFLLLHAKDNKDPQKTNDDLGKIWSEKRNADLKVKLPEYLLKLRNLKYRLNQRQHKNSVSQEDIAGLMNCVYSLTLDEIPLRSPKDISADLSVNARFYVLAYKPLCEQAIANAFHGDLEWGVEAQKKENIRTFSLTWLERRTFYVLHSSLVLRNSWNAELTQANSLLEGTCEIANLNIFLPKNPLQISKVISFGMGWMSGAPENRNAPDYHAAHRYFLLRHLLSLLDAQRVKRQQTIQNVVHRFSWESSVTEEVFLVSVFSREGHSNMLFVNDLDGFDQITEASLVVCLNSVDDYQLPVRQILVQYMLGGVYPTALLINSVDMDDRDYAWRYEGTDPISPLVQTVLRAEYDAYPFNYDREDPRLSGAGTPLKTRLLKNNNLTLYIRKERKLPASGLGSTGQPATGGSSTGRGGSSSGFVTGRGGGPSNPTGGRKATS